MKKNLQNIIVTVIFLLTLVGCAMPSGSSNSSDVIDALGVEKSAVASVLEPSQVNPRNLPTSEVPMFVSIGFDDNSYTGLPASGGDGGMKWALDYFRTKTSANGIPARVSFFYASIYGDSWQIENPELVQQIWKQAYTDGHEVGNHSRSHPDNAGRNFTLDKWLGEMQSCQEFLTRPTNGLGIPASDITGWRTPFLKYDNNTMSAIRQMPGYEYDCSINEGFQADQDGTNFFWPYTMHNGSPGNKLTSSWDPPNNDPLLGSHPGLYELPVYALIVPPDDKCVEYGVPVGLRDSIKARKSWFNTQSGKITGFDYNLWFLYNLSKEEFVATLKYSFDIRRAGNKAPFMLGAHTDYYAKRYNNPADARSNYIERQQALEEFMDYVLTKQDVEVVPFKDILGWIKGDNPPPTHTVTINAGPGGSASPSGQIKVVDGGSLDITITPDTGFAVDKVTVTPTPATPVNNVLSLRNITQDLTVTITFIKLTDTFTIKASAGPNGTLTPSGDVVVKKGDTVVFEAVPNAGYNVASVLYNGQTHPINGTTITIPNVQADGTLEVTFGGGPDLVAVYEITSDWGSGFNGKVTITNNSTQTINGWTAEWTYAGDTKVGSLWNASFVQSGKTVTVNNLSWNGTLAPGKTVSFGFGGTHSTPEIPAVTVSAK